MLDLVDLHKTFARGTVNAQVGLDGLSLRQQEELMERLAELVGIDADKFITLFLDQLKESGE